MLAAKKIPFTNKMFQMEKYLEQRHVKIVFSV